MNRVAVITGGATGIGLAIASKLQYEGFNPVLLGRRAEVLRDAARRLDDAAWYVCDVADPDSVGVTTDSLLREHGTVHALVNNAGVVRNRPLSALDPKATAQQIDTNLVGVINCTFALSPALKETGGAIVNISSALASCPRPGTSVYSATKAAVEAFTRACAIELTADGVRVNAVAPGLVRTGIYAEDGIGELAFEQMLQSAAKRYLLGRYGQPEDIVGAVSFLLSDSASWITGTTIPVDSGLRDCGLRFTQQS